MLLLFFFFSTVESADDLRLLLVLLLGLFGHDEARVLLFHKFVARHQRLRVVFVDYELFLARLQQSHFLQLVEQVQILRRILTALVDPGEQLLDLLLRVHLHELAAGAREVVAIQRRAVKDRLVSLCLLFVVPSDFVDDVVEVENAHLLSEVLHALRRPPFHHLLSANVDERAVSEAAHATAPFVALEHFFVPENTPLEDALQLVTDCAGILADFPTFFVDGEPEVAVDLNDGLLHQLAPAAHVDSVRVLTDVIHGGSLRQFYFLSHRVQVNEANSVPRVEESQVRQKFKAPLSLHYLVLVKNLLVV
mmetsp:Transcript_24946/g.33410  ORF Transcript_24946/g.33410 Transcript_24946/m.33410 type:complete len:307 (-) Transcript_24946:976-1896(-)